MKKNDKELINMPFNSEEFGKLLLEENYINEVIIEEPKSLIIEIVVIN